MKINYLKKNNGIMLSDAIVSILLIMLFSGLTISLIYNIVLENVRTKANSMQISYATEIFEYAEKCSFDEVTTQNLIQYINDKNSEQVSAGTSLEQLTTNDKISINVENYNETEDNTDKYNLIKIITLEIESKVGKKTCYTKISTLKKANLEEAIEIVN